MASLRGVMAGIAVLALSGCAVAGTDTDTGTNQDSGVRVDVPRTDSGPRDSGGGGRDVVFSLDSGGGGGSSAMFGRCNAAGDCRDAGSSCLTAFPGGMCTATCTSDATCNGGHCVSVGTQSICFPNCTSGGAECDTVGGACVPNDSTGTTFVCLPSCFTSGAPAGFPSCNSGLSCDLWSGFCQASPSTGADDGAACTADADCRGGRCITELNMGSPTGWLSGYCLSFGRAAAVMQGAPVPQSNCPPGAGVVPLSGEQPGDSAPCLKTCNANTDCRAGYQCDHLTPSGGTGAFFSNGICLPVDCLMTGMSCPSGTTCRTMSGTSGNYGVCAH